MPPVWFPEYQLAVGFNNVAGLVTLEGTTVTNDTQPFIYPKALRSFDIGVRKTRSTGGDYFAGFSNVTWQWWVTWLQWKHLKDTYCGGGYSGDVTVRTRTSGLTYANYNAIMKLPKEAELRDITAPILAETRILFTRLVVIPDET